MTGPDNPILNSPYAEPERHWQLGENGTLTSIINPGRRRSEYVVPIAQPKKSAQQGSLGLEQDVTPNELINEIRGHVARWRTLPAGQAGVQHETARLLDHWREGRMAPRPFFCQVEAVETIIWLEEVAAKQRQFSHLRDQLVRENEAANPGLFRLACKMATGAGKTTVMAMLIAWQTVNAAKGRKSFTDAFLIITPGITIRDRLRVLLPSDTENYYATRGIVPDDMIADIRKARIVITNYHAFKPRDTQPMAGYARKVMAGRGEEPRTLETPGQMLKRVCPELLARKTIVVINDEAHHCYQENPEKAAERAVAADEKEEVKRNREAARLWINGIRAFKEKNIQVRAVYDLSATPFFLRGSGYGEGRLFPWVVSDFSLMDAIECGIVKVPRVPVSDNALNLPMPAWRNLWAEIRDDMPKKGRAKQENLDPENLPEKLLGALHALYEHYERFHANWATVFGAAGLTIPPVFIVVCQNTSHSKLIHDYIAGYERTERTAAGEERTVVAPGKLALFSNYDEDKRRIPRPRTLLIDSTELDSGEMSAEFKKIAREEIEAFKAEKAHREGQGAAERIADDDLLREVMNTVGKAGKLGESVRCVVSVSMLTEGWDANTVTHILGVRAFGTQLLCEQVVGRGLRRVNYDLNEHGLFNAEAANIFGIPFSFAQEKKDDSTVVPPKPTRRVRALPERDALAIRFPRVMGYRVKLPGDRLVWRWDADSRFELNPSNAGPTHARVEDVLGAGETIGLDEWMREQRLSTVAFHVAGHALRTRFRDEDDNLKPYLFPRLLTATRDWLDTQLTCTGGTAPGLMLWRGLADEAALRIYNACVRGGLDGMAGGEAEPHGLLLPIMDAYNPEGSTAHVDFQTSREPLHTTDPARCHVTLVVGDSASELAFCETLEGMPEVLAYVKNHGLNFEVPYAVAGGERRYRPDFIVRIDDGAGADDPLNLICEIKGYRRLDAQNKKEAMDTHWIPAVNNHGGFGRWAFIEIGDVYQGKTMIREHLKMLKHTHSAKAA